MSTGIIPITGRVVKDDPTITFANSGTAVTHFTVVSSYRKQNKVSKEWEDTDTTFYRCTAFGQLAENIAENIERGSSVVLLGRLSQEDWMDKSGGQRTSIKVIVENLGEDLRRKKKPQEDQPRADLDDEPPF